MNSLLAKNGRSTRGTVRGFKAERGRSPRAFTLLEVLFSILVIGVLLGLLIAGIQASGVFARSAADRQMVSSMALGVRNFKEQFGFAPPLIKDAATVAQLVEVSNSRNRIKVFQAADSQDADDLREVQSDPTNVNLANPFADSRYSVISLPTYLCGALDARFSSATGSLTIDGIQGPGFYKPNRSGTFDVPKDVVAAAAGGSDSARVGEQFESLVNLSSSIKLGFAADGVPQLADRNGVVIRYYTWLTGREYVANSNNFETRVITDYNFPPLVAHVSTPSTKLPDERNPELNASLRGASWAIVAAGPNKVFGDESNERLSEALSKPMPTNPVGERQLRALAAADNVVEVGE